MITLTVLFLLFCSAMVILAVAFGIIAVSPILLIIIALPLLDYLVYKLIKAIMNK